MDKIKESSAQANAVSEQAEFVCDCHEEARSACEPQPFYKWHGGKRYCVLHYPSKKKTAAFNDVLKRRLQVRNFDFSGAWFPGDVDFSGFAFSAKANFSRAKFAAEARFREAKFSAGADFSRATFDARADFVMAEFGPEAGANFYSAKFGKNADFYNATFCGGAAFDSATFSAMADFDLAAFEALAGFNSATFSDHGRFSEVQYPSADDSSMDFQEAIIEKPGGISFHSTTLRPHWFVRVDARKFEFTNVDWNWHHIRIKREIEELNRREVPSPYRMLSIACSMLAVNAEENQRYDEASRFRYLAMKIGRKERWWRRVALWRLDWWYWIASGYGERVWQATGVLLCLLTLFGFLYSRVGFEAVGAKPPDAQQATVQPDRTGEPLPLGDSFLYSAQVAAFQKPDPKPLTRWARSLVFAETVLGPAQAALLLLAIRRKFMR
jgi:hypothetical protein